MNCIIFLNNINVKEFKMKKLLIIFVLAIATSSCYVSVDKSVEDPLKETTSYLQNLPKDTTVSVSFENSTIYVFDKKTNLVKYKAESIEEDSFPIGIIPLLMALFFCIYDWCNSRQ